jgi:ectoine hydroxylase-related dioxygenase (phytanoyl-CoA dioxygenase family)
MLTDEQLGFYRENGYVLVPGLLSPAEAAHYRQRLHDLAERLYVQSDKGHDATWGAARQMSGGTQTKLQHCHDVQFYDAAFARLITDERLAGAASSIIGPNVQLHHTKMFIKPPEKGSPFPMHQDVPYFPHDHHSMIAAIIHFDDAPLEKGCVRVVPGSHKLGVLEHEKAWYLPLDRYPVEAATPCPAKAGDVLFFSYLTIHGSGINVSTEARTTLLVQMRDPLDPPTFRTHESRGQGTMLYGIDPSCCTVQPSSETQAAVSMGGGRGAPAMGGMG